MDVTQCASLRVRVYEVSVLVCDNGYVVRCWFATMDTWSGAGLRRWIRGRQRPALPDSHLCDSRPVATTEECPAMHCKPRLFSFFCRNTECPISTMCVHTPEPYQNHTRTIPEPYQNHTRTIPEPYQNHIGRCCVAFHFSSI
jgi:hypothetical protein